MFCSYHLFITLGLAERAVSADHRDIGVRENLGREERQHAANNDALHHVRDNGSRMGSIQNSRRAKYERPDNKGADYISKDGAVYRYYYSASPWR
jgi:hypothetical protein